MAKDTKPQTEPATDSPGAPSAGDQPAAGNTLQRASTVIRQLGLSKPVAAGVLAQHGLTQLSMVNPAVFEKQVSDWLASPAQK